jgi:tripartite-type tricarboxylate transporter receptor subunit TctC
MNTRATRARRSAVWLAALALVVAACGGEATEETTVEEPATETTAGAETPETTAAAETPETTAAAEGVSFEGETITLVVPYDAGGGFDQYARGVAPYLAEELGADVVIDNRPGAGGLIGANVVFQAEGDGLTIGIINYPGAVFGALTEQEGVSFDNSQWQVLGRIAAVSPMIYAGADSGFATWEDVVASESDVVFSLGGVGSDAYYGTAVIGNALGFPYQLITGYDGTSEQNAAVLAGEAQLTFASLDSASSFLESGDGVPLVYLSEERAADYPDVPTIIEVAGDSENIMSALAAVYSLERIIVAPPGTPDEIADALGEALIAAMTNEAFIADMAALERSLNVLDRAGATALIGEVAAGLTDLEPLLTPAE